MQLFIYKVPAVTEIFLVTIGVGNLVSVVQLSYILLYKPIYVYCGHNLFASILTLEKNLSLYNANGHRKCMIFNRFKIRFFKKWVQPHNLAKNIHHKNRTLFEYIRYSVTRI